MGFGLYVGGLLFTLLLLGVVGLLRFACLFLGVCV